MPEEGFLRRWARVKASGPEAQAEVQAQVQAQAQAKVETKAQPPARAPEAPAAVAPWPWGRAGDTLPETAAPAAERADAPATGPADGSGRASPTLEDVARLTPDSDYSIFVGQGVDKSVQRLALKKLFADPHFNVLDRLDMYMDDYNIPSPVSAEMLAQLDHARSALRRFVEEPAAALAADGSTPAEVLAAADPLEAAPERGAPEANPADPAHEAHPAHEAPETHTAPSHKEAALAAAAHEDGAPGELPAATPGGAPTHDNGPIPPSTPAFA